MMKTILPTAILDYYDGVRVFAGRDPIGGNYVGSMIGAVNGVDRYLVTGTDPERLRQFRVGLLDLRTLMLEAPDGEWYLTLADGQPGQPLVLQPQDEPLIATGFLPQSGYLLEEGPVDDVALQQARERGNVVFEFRVEPPESAYGHRIRAATLAGVLNYVQAMVRFAYSSALRELSSRAKSRIDSTDGHLMDVVVPAAAGSYRVILEAAKSPDMFGCGELTRGLQKLDDVFSSASDPDTARDLLQEHKGRLAGSYIKLINFLADHDTGLWYSWADGMSVNSHHGGVSEANAKKLAQILSSALSLSVENVTLVGSFERVNRSAGDWGLLTHEGTKTGKVADGGPRLEGLEVGRRYRFDCLEEVEIDAVGREKRNYLLLDIHNN